MTSDCAAHHERNCQQRLLLRLVRPDNNDVVLGGYLSGGYLEVRSGGTAIGTAVSGSFLQVDSGGTAGGTTVSNGGFEGGGVCGGASGALVSSGGAGGGPRPMWSISGGVRRGRGL